MDQNRLKARSEMRDHFEHGEEEAFTIGIGEEIFYSDWYMCSGIFIVRINTRNHGSWRPKLGFFPKGAIDKCARENSFTIY